jgi:alanyl-tRNA synthetase
MAVALVTSAIISYFAFQFVGSPIDLTQLIASEKGFKVDEVGYEKALKKQKDRSRAASLLETGDWIILKDGDSKFVGYNLTETTTQVIKYRKVKSQGKEIYQIVLETTPFYAESGGQIGDSGSLFFEGANQIIQVIDTKKEIDLNIHFTEKIPVDLTGSVKSKVDVFRRRSIANHHSATHLLHAALRKVLGLHVSQKGSLVSEEILRFDFSHFNKVADDEIRKIEEMVNEKIRQNIKVDFKKMSKDEATEIGAMSLFGEKYKDEVRVVIMDFDFSKELCGGTHVSSTGELGLFKITSESSIASGVRRIEAITGVATEKYINEQLDQLLKAKEILKHPKDIIKSIQSIADENARLKKDLEKNEQAQIKILSTALVEKIQMIKDIQFIGEVVEISNAEALKKIAFDLKSHLSSFAIVLAANIQGKPAVVLLFDEHMATEKGLDASKIVKQRIAPIIKGGGGGQKTLATAGGQDVSALHQVIEAVKTLF